MKFKYISNTPDAPKKTVIFGYKFELDGEPVEVTDEFVIKKLLGAAHAGFIMVDFQEGEFEDIVEKTSSEKTRELVLSKTYKELFAFKEKNGLQIESKKKEDLQEAIINYLIENVAD